MRHGFSDVLHGVSRWLILWAALAPFIAGGVANAVEGACTTVCYVDASAGDDTNSGEPTAPFKTIQKALDTVASGGTVHVAAGAYNPNINTITKSVTVYGAQHGVQVSGRDPGSIAESAITANTGFSIQGTGAVVTIDGFTFKEKTPGLSAGVSVRWNAGATVTVGHNIFSNTKTGVSLSSSTVPPSLVITGNLFTGGGTGVAVSGMAGATLSVVDNMFTGLTTLGIQAAAWTGATISGNEVTNTGGTQAGIQINNCAACTVSGNQVSGGTAAFGIQVMGASPSVVSGNTVTNVAGSGIGISGSGAQVKNNIIAGAASAGILVYNFISNTQVTGNTVSGPGAIGVFADYLFGTGTGPLTIMSNSLSGLATGVVLEYPATVESNVITGSTSIGVDVRTGGDVAATHINANAIAGNTAGLTAPATNSVDATCNWWGAASGPSGVGSGTGDSVSGAVQFAPWLTASTLSMPCDKTAPSITIATPADGAFYSLGQVVASGYGCTDADSGIALCDGTVANGAAFDTSTTGSHTFTVNARDVADNEATQSTEYTVINAAGPSITITTPGQGTTYVRGATALAAYVCTPGDAVITACTGDVPDGAAIDTSTVGSHTFTVNAADANSLTAVAQVTYSVRAPEGPTVTITAPVQGTTYVQGAIVAAAYSCTPGDGSVDSCTGDVPVGGAIDTSALGSHTFTVNATDENGLAAIAQVTYSVRAPEGPTVTITTPVHGATYVQGATVLAAYTCTPGENPIVSCSGDVPAGAAIDTLTPGPHSFTVEATDSAALKTTLDVGYTVSAADLPPTVPPPAEATPPPANTERPRYTLFFRWTLTTWAGIDSIGIGDALRGEGPNAAGNSIIAEVTAVFSYEAGTEVPGRWRAYFPGREGVPHANDLSQLRNGQPYWIAIRAPGPVTWEIVPGVAAP